MNAKPMNAITALSKIQCPIVREMLEHINEMNDFQMREFLTGLGDVLRIQASDLLESGHGDLGTTFMQAACSIDEVAEEVTNAFRNRSKSKAR